MMSAEAGYSVNSRDHRVSVVVAVRDGERYLAEALDSILRQSTTPGEVVVVDDGSTDATPVLLERYAAHVRVVRQSGAGVAAALNRGIAIAHGTLLAFLDADDVWLPDALRCRLTRIDAADDPDAVFGRMQQFVSPELDASHVAGLHFDPTPRDVTLFGTMLVRRSAVDRVGPLDRSYTTGANIDWMSRARAIGLRTAELTDIVMRRRLHQTNLGIVQAERKRTDLVRVVRAHLQRQPPTETKDER
jgi:glycosyltransferase involved in cell wall biosynthesis